MARKMRFRTSLACRRSTSFPALISSAHEVGHAVHRYIPNSNRIRGLASNRACSPCSCTLSPSRVLRGASPDPVGERRSWREHPRHAKPLHRPRRRFWRYRRPVWQALSCPRFLSTDMLVFLPQSRSSMRLRYQREQFTLPNPPSCCKAAYSSSTTKSEGPSQRSPATARYRQYVRIGDTIVQ